MRRPAGRADHADAGTPIDAATKLNAYDVSLIGIDLRDIQKTHQGQDIVWTKPDGEYVVSPERVKSWVEEPDRVIAMDGTVPMVDPAARRFVEALRVVMIGLQSLDSDYRMRANLADKLSRGRR